MPCDGWPRVGEGLDDPCPCRGGVSTLSPAGEFDSAVPWGSRLPVAISPRLLRSVMPPFFFCFLFFLRGRWGSVDEPPKVCATVVTMGQERRPT